MRGALELRTTQTGEAEEFAYHCAVESYWGECDESFC